MKKLYIIATFLLGLLLASCADSFLDLNPESQSNEKIFYKTESDFERAVAGVYEKLRPTRTWADFLMGESRSDNAHYTYSAAVSHSIKPEDIVDFIDDSQNPITNDMYFHLFDAIARANTLLDHLEGKNFSEDFTNKIIGQAKFLRAYNYFMLVQYFGEVPLHLHQVANAEAAFLSRSSVESVYAQIIDDATDAKNRLATIEFSDTGFGSGRVTKGTAHMLLAKVSMTKPNRDYAEAETHLREIMKMGYDLLGNYADVFDPKNKNSKESLFEVQYQEGNLGQQSGWLYKFMPKTRLGEIITGVGGTNTTTWGGYNVPTQDLIDTYESGDTRLNASIIVAAGKNDKDNNFVPEKMLNVGDPQISTYPVMYYMVNKYRHAHAKVENTDDNWPIYRYSDVLLSLAECLIEQNKAADALPYINKVRSRAQLGDASSATAEVVALERRHEFAFENQRWHDLVRTGKAIEVMMPYGVKMKAQYPNLVARTYNVTKERLLFPIPYREIQINKQLTQNPGY